MLCFLSRYYYHPQLTSHNQETIRPQLSQKQDITPIHDAHAEFRNISLFRVLRNIERISEKYRESTNKVSMRAKSAVGQSSQKNRY